MNTKFRAEIFKVSWSFVPKFLPQKIWKNLSSTSPWLGIRSERLKSGFYANQPKHNSSFFNIYYVFCCICATRNSCGSQNVFHSQLTTPPLTYINCCWPGWSRLPSDYGFFDCGNFWGICQLLSMVKKPAKKNTEYYLKYWNVGNAAMLE